MKIRITKEFHFEMSHCLNNYNGPCANIHGHSYRLLITLRGEPQKDSFSSTFGMVMDFKKLKDIVKKQVIDVLDHCFVINKESVFIPQVEVLNTKKLIVDFQPTCENLVIFIKAKIEPFLDKDVELYEVALYETASSKACWNKEDE